MAKSPPGVRLLRSLARAGKAQQKLLTAFLTASTPKTAKPKKPRRTARRTQISLAAAPGKWMAARYPALSGVPSLAYWLYLPDRVPESVTRNGWPLIVMLHGCHQSATQFAQGTRMNLLAEHKGYAVLYPQQPVSAHAQRCWHWYSQATQEGSGDAAKLASLIAHICEQHHIDRSRIYACGISAGAGMTAVMALQHPELFAAIGLHSGPVAGVARSSAEALHVMRHGASLNAEGVIHELLHQRALQTKPGARSADQLMPAILIQGEADKVVRPVNQAHLARQWLALNGLGADTPSQVTLKPEGKTVRRNACEIRDFHVGRKILLRVASIAGLGHAWSGGDPSYKFNEAAGPDASRMMLDFFAKHRR
ncbi:extracellular catalytic domain type 1 short-chain-length polyhydroxyalkanoate depolymerase [Pseudoduganella sp. R-43]|uniref:extracellular catalytic domain type 1 short-chain-length polyhydroxyalkanoate depolymerase n=1 Tax=unclassified Pseudoduganella TaxID=2637179 RepID=UPI003CF0829A